MAGRQRKGGGAPQRYAPWTTNHEALWREVRKCNARKVRMFVGANAGCVAWTNAAGRTALHEAAAAADAETAEVLLSNGADADAVAHDDGLTSLHVACRRGAPDVVETLLVHGADARLAREADGTTPLHSAAENHTTGADAARRIVALLVAHGADINAVDKAGDTPLARALSGGGGGDGCVSEVAQAIKNFEKKKTP
jgi:ankyrin repeat protein